MRDILKELIFFYLLQKSIIVFAPWMKDHIVVDYEQMKYYKPNVHDRTLHLNSTEPGLHLAFKLDLDAHAVFVHLMRFVGCELFKKEVYYFLEYVSILKLTLAFLESLHRVEYLFLFYLYSETQHY